MRHWTFLCAAILSAVSACGGRAADSSAGAASGSGGGPAAGGASGSGSGGDAGSGGAGARACTGSLESVSMMARFVCPPTLCDATAWAVASCSTWLSVSAATGHSCTGLRAFTLSLEDGETQTCTYAAESVPNKTGSPAPMLDGALVGALLTANDPRFCAGTADAISGGVQLPSDCTEAEPSSKLCDRASAASSGATPTSDDAAAPAACPDAFSSSCAPCCPANTPDCAGKPDGYPGYSCTPAPTSSGASFCSCGCSAGQWQCGC